MKGSYPFYTELLYKEGPRFGEFCSCCCLPLLPQLACSILATWGPPYTGSLYMCSYHPERPVSRSDRSRLHHPRPRPFISEGRKARGQRPEIMPANDPTSTTMLPAASVNFILHAWQAAGHRGAHTNVFKWQGINKMPLLRGKTGNSDILPSFQGYHYI